MARKTRGSTNPNRNITRIETNPTNGHRPIRGWEVRIYRRGVRFNKFFSDSAHGGTKKALEETCKVRDKMERKMKPYTRKELAEKVTARNTSGHRGIRLRKTNIKFGNKVYSYDHVEASWSPEAGKIVKKSFSIAKLGLEKAWAAAVAVRKEAVDGIKG